jgi:CRP/FNR family transcriptional regulator, cyclic AMP receptor protein
VKPKRKPPFSVKTFLATVAGGRTISTYRKSETVFSQGDEGFDQAGPPGGHDSRQARPHGGVLRMLPVGPVARRIPPSKNIRLKSGPPPSSRWRPSEGKASRVCKPCLVPRFRRSSERRLARLLLLLANFGKEGRPEPIVGKISQETLAESTALYRRPRARLTRNGCTRQTDG